MHYINFILKIKIILYSQNICYGGNTRCLMKLIVRLIFGNLIDNEPIHVIMVIYIHNNP